LLATSRTLATIHAAQKADLSSRKPIPLTSRPTQRKPESNRLTLARCDLFKEILVNAKFDYLGTWRESHGT
jgi:hypothetical protein